MREKLARLLQIRNLVALVLTGVFSVLALTERVDPEKFIMIFASVAAFYFGAPDRDER